MRDVSTAETRLSKARTAASSLEREFQGMLVSSCFKIFVLFSRCKTPNYGNEI